MVGQTVEWGSVIGRLRKIEEFEATIINGKKLFPATAVDNGAMGDFKEPARKALPVLITRQRLYGLDQTS